MCKRSLTHRVPAGWRCWWGTTGGQSGLLPRGKPVIPVHHMEGHLLSPLLADPAPAFPFIALLVSGGHTQLMQVDGVGQYTLLGDTIDDAAGEAFDKSAKLLGLAYPGGPLLAKLADGGDPRHLPSRARCCIQATSISALRGSRQPSPTRYGA